MNNELEKKSLRDEIDWIATLVPLFGVLFLGLLFLIFPDSSSAVLEGVRGFLGDQFSIYYAMLGVGVFLCSMYVAFSKYGRIVLGGNESKVEYSNFQWGVMIFTSTMAADIVFYAMIEWALYAQESYLGELGSIQKWASTFPLFHWGPIAWGFYIMLAVAFGFMLHNRKVEKQKFSEACRPLLGDKVDGWMGKVIDLIAIFALIAGTATTFSLATPLLSAAMSQVFGIQNSKLITIVVLLLIAVVYTSTVMLGMEAVSKLAAICTYLFFALLAYFLFLGGETVYILETGFSAIGNLVQNFIGMSTWLDPLRETSFPQKWTIYYWSYWMVWCVATPFFIGSISKGRTIREVILGGYIFGLSGTFISFIILGNYGIALNVFGQVDLLKLYTDSNNLYTTIGEIISSLPLPYIAMILLILTMITFYATTFDSITLVAASYSYKDLEDKEPSKQIKLYWSILLILLPIGLIFSDNSMSNLQTISIIAAFPIGIIMILLIISFFKDANMYLNE